MYVRPCTQDVCDIICVLRVCSGDPNNLSVTNELAKLPNDEHNQVAEKPSSPSGGKGSQKPYFYTNPPRHSTESILDKTSLTDDLDSQKTPYVKLSPFTVRYTSIYFNNALLIIHVYLCTYVSYHT